MTRTGTLLRIAVLAVVIATAAPAMAAQRSVTLTVDGMTCASCPYIVRKTLAAVPGVSEVAVSFNDKTAVVTFDDAKTGVAALMAATAGVGFPSRPVE